LAKRRVNVWVLLCYLVIALFMAYIVLAYIVMDPKKTGIISGKFESIKNFPYDVWKYFLLFHVTTGSIALIIGPFQFLKASRKNKKIHRTIGKTYMTSIFLSVPAGIYLAFYATGGLGSGIGFAVLDILWFASAFMGFKRIRQRNIQSHQEWMLRSYAITLVFVTFRILMPISVFVMGLGFSIGFPLAIFAAIGINLALTEWYLRTRNKKTIRNTNPSQVNS